MAKGDATRWGHDLFIGKTGCPYCFLLGYNAVQSGTWTCYTAIFYPSASNMFKVVVSSQQMASYRGDPELIFLHSRWTCCNFAHNLQWYQQDINCSSLMKKFSISVNHASWAPTVLVFWRLTEQINKQVSKQANKQTNKQTHSAERRWHFAQSACNENTSIRLGLLHRLRGDGSKTDILYRFASPRVIQSVVVFLSCNSVSS